MTPPPSRYGFYDRLTGAFPSQVIVDVTEVCNLACIHCPHPNFKESDHYGGRHLDIALHRKLIDEIRDHGSGSTRYIRYTSNGEPLVHPGIYDMLDDAVRRSGVFVTLTTNGTILNEKRIERLLASGLDMIDVSIDAATPKTYAAIRVNGQLDATSDNVMRLIELKRGTGARTKIAVSFVEQPLNASETETFRSRWESAGADHVVIRRQHSAAGCVAEVAARIRADAAQERYPCVYPWERILLNPRGELTFCPEDWVHASIVADYRTSTIRAAWNGEFYRALRHAHLSGEFSRHPFCGQCPDWRQTRWPGQGRSYADLVQDCLQPPHDQ